MQLCFIVVVFFLILIISFKICVQPWTSLILPHIETCTWTQVLLLYLSWFFNSLSFKLFSSVLSDSWWSHGLQHARLPCLSPTPRAHSDSCPSSQWCHSTISSSAVPFSPTFNLSQHQSLFRWVSYLHQVAKVLEFQLQHQSFQWISGLISKALQTSKVNSERWDYLCFYFQLC